MVKIALDAGHGLYTPGKRTPDNEREWSFNNKVLLACAAELNKYHNVSILRLDDHTGQRDVPLKERTDKANRWGADVLVSIHHNANTSKWGSWGGVETFVYRTNNGKAHQLANTINPKIFAAMGLRNRGVKTKNLHMLRESNMPALLTEGGFMDSLTDIGALRDDDKLKKQGVAIATGIAEFYDLKKKESKKEDKEMDDMNQELSPTAKKDMRNLLQYAYDTKVFSDDHVPKVDKMTRGEALDLLVSYNARISVSK